MRSRFPSVLAAALVLLAAPRARAAEPPVPGGVLRVCADPNNLPFSNDRLEGFENRIAALVARDLGATVSYTWRAQRRGFFRQTLKAGRCDVVMGVPTGLGMAAATRPYYRSTYVFVTRADRAGVRSFEDPALRRLRVGVQLAGKDGANTPPAHALSERGIVANVVGFTLYGDYGEPNPPARILDAVADGSIDVAIVWGPLAGYFAKRERPRLALHPVAEPAAASGALPFAFDIAVGVRRGDEPLRRAIDGVLARRHAAIDEILEAYGVPRVTGGER